MNTTVNEAVKTALNFDAPTVAEKYVLVKCEAQFPPASRKSEKARQAMIADMVANGADPATADAMAHGSLDLFPDGELKEIKSPYYAFITLLNRVSIRWLGGKGAPKLLSIHMLDKLEQEFAKAQMIMLPLIRKFVANYQQTLTDLENKGGQYFDLSSYPTVEEIEHKFRFDFNMTAIGDPTQFDLGTVSAAQQQRMIDAMKETAEAVTKEYAKSMHDALKQLQTQLMGGKQNGKFVRFSESNVSNLMDMVQADLNASGSPELAEAMCATEHACKAAAIAAENKDCKHTRDAAANDAAAAARKLAHLF